MIEFLSRIKQPADEEVPFVPDGPSRNRRPVTPAGRDWPMPLRRWHSRGWRPCGATRPCKALDQPVGWEITYIPLGDSRYGDDPQARFDETRKIGTLVLTVPTDESRDIKCSFPAVRPPSTPIEYSARRMATATRITTVPIFLVPYQTGHLKTGYLKFDGLNANRYDPAEVAQGTRISTTAS